MQIRGGPGNKYPSANRGDHSSVQKQLSQAGSAVVSQSDVLPGAGAKNAAGRDKNMGNASGVQQVGVEIARRSSGAHPKVGADRASVIPLRDGIGVDQIGRFDPGFNGHSRARADVQGGGSQDFHLLIGSIETKGLANFASGEGNAIREGAVVCSG